MSSLSHEFVYGLELSSSSIMQNLSRVAVEVLCDGFGGAINSRVSEFGNKNLRFALL